MIHFNCDYSEGAHPKVLEKLLETNLEQTLGYGEDPYCRKAAETIKEKCGAPGADVHFLVGGTPANLITIASALRPHQGAVAAVTGHINVHESGAIEATGHKVLALQGDGLGKLTANEIQRAFDEHWNDPTHEHMVQPKLVYISNPTELGTIYTNAELTAISETCRKNGLYLYMDGARLSYALTAKGNDLDLPTIAALCDAFYIVGTKVGALFGEALVITNDALKQDFRYILKQKGGMLAKGRLLGLQFIALMEDDLYFGIGEHANSLAAQIREACAEKGYRFLTPSPTNQQFPIMPRKVIETLKKDYEFEIWREMDAGHNAVRFCISWATREEDVQRLIKSILED